MPSRPPAPDAQLAEFLSRFPPETAALSKKCLLTLRRALPGVPQLVYDYRASVVVSFSPSERGAEGVVGMAVDPRCVRLYFPKDTPDPRRRLQGRGSMVRSVTLGSASDLDDGDVPALIRAAVERSGVDLPFAPTGRVVIQSESGSKAKSKPKPEPKPKGKTKKAPRSAARS